MTRITFIAYLACTDNTYVQVADLFGNALSKHFGGATVSKQRGYWADDGQEYRELYAGDVNIETVAAIHLQVLAEYEERAITLLRETAKIVVRELSLTAKHLHIECHHSEAMHTDISITA
ncbi:hypothetical protein [Psychromonas antarctica]|uniref:hypothetical protein n=1 Tax=Psychromonas antarctica TaxID=67573 RepID=UPI001EE7E68F|nr:hypothetical protein [Psychromonas antarctica]MCG6201082.1 hypothetical protein [Psychromonas antarctica]